MNVDVITDNNIHSSPEHTAGIDKLIDCITGEEKEISPAEIHKQYVVLKDEHKYSDALKICTAGIMRFPNEKTLLLDIISCYTKMENEALAVSYFERFTNNIERETWDERCYRICIGFMMGTELFSKNAIINYIEEFHNKYPLSEDAFLTEASFYISSFESEKAKTILKKAIDDLKRAPKCALQLLQLQLSDGEIDDAEQTSDYFMIASYASDSDFDIGYFAYSRCLIDDVLLHRRSMNKEGISRGEVDKVRNEYIHIMDKYMRIKIDYGFKINNRILMLQFIRTTD